MRKAKSEKYFLSDHQDQVVLGLIISFFVFSIYSIEKLLESIFAVLGVEKTDPILTSIVILVSIVIFLFLIVKFLPRSSFEYYEVPLMNLMRLGLAALAFLPSFYLIVIGLLFDSAVISVLGLVFTTLSAIFIVKYYARVFSHL